MADSSQIKLFVTLWDYVCSFFHGPEFSCSWPLSFSGIVLSKNHHNVFVPWHVVQTMSGTLQTAKFYFTSCIASIVIGISVFTSELYSCWGNTCMQCYTYIHRRVHNRIGMHDGANMCTQCWTDTQELVVVLKKYIYYLQVWPCMLGNCSVVL